MPIRSKTKVPLPYRLRSARERAGLSQKDLGVVAGIDPDSASARINQYEQGKHAPDFQTASRLAVCLQVPVEYLYALDDRVAELILNFNQLNKKSQDKILSDIADIIG